MKETAKIFNKVTRSEMEVDSRMVDLLNVLNANGLDILLAEIGHEENNYKDFYIKFRPNTSVDALEEIFEGLPVVIDSKSKQIDGKWRTWSTIRLDVDRYMLASDDTVKALCLEKISAILSQETVDSMHIKFQSMFCHADDPFVNKL